MKPFAVNALVPYLGAIVPVQSRSRNGEHGWTYCVHTRAPDRALLIHGEVPHAVILANIGALAHYAVGQTVLFKERYPMTIVHRAWSFRKGTVVYNCSRPGMARNDKHGTRAYTQEEVFAHVEADETPGQVGSSKWDPERFY